MPDFIRIFLTAWSLRDLNVTVNLSDVEIESPFIALFWPTEWASTKDPF